MNLGELKAIVDTWMDEDFVFSSAFLSPHSYRGYYDELSFWHNESGISVSSIKDSLNQAFTDVFYGWKGGEYTYDAFTLVHLSPGGCCDDDDGHNFEELVGRMNKEYQVAHSFFSIVCYNTPMETKTETKMTTHKRKTAAEHRAEADALRLEDKQFEEAKFRSSYQYRLLKLVHTFVREEQFCMGVDLEEAYEFQLKYTKVQLPFDLSEAEVLEHVMADVEEVEHFVEAKREEQRLAQERAAKKTAALAKLTKEERELLGFPS